MTVTSTELETTLPETGDRDYEFTTDDEEGEGGEGEGSAAGAPSAGSDTPPPPALVDAEASAVASPGITADQLPISLHMQFAPADGNPAGRQVVLGIRLGQGVPIIYALREADLGGELPKVITDKIEELAATGVMPKSSVTVTSPSPATPAKSAPAAQPQAKSVPSKAGAGAQQMDLLSLFDDLED